jgi:hypothetical protein
MDALQQLALTVLPGRFAICRLAAEAATPAWAQRGSFVSVTRTADELSIVCPEVEPPAGVAAQGGWRCLRVDGPLDLGLIGVLASIVEPLADARISVFAVSTYDTDHVLIRGELLASAVETLRSVGHVVRDTE